MSLGAATCLAVPAWTPVLNQTWPAIDVSDHNSLSGWVGLAPTGTNWQHTPSAPQSCGEVTFRWWADPDAQESVSVKGLPLASSIPSNAQVLLANLGPYLTVQFQAFRFDNTGAPALEPAGFGMRLIGSRIETQEHRLLLADAILIDEKDTLVNAAVYPSGYYAGPMLAYLDAPAGVVATLQEFDLEAKWWAAAKEVAGGNEEQWDAPFGAWFVYVVGPTGARFTLTVTPAS